MWEAVKRNKKRISMGKKAGCEFIEFIFGRNRELETGEADEQYQTVEYGSQWLIWIRALKPSVFDRDSGRRIPNAASTGR
jgi:hypothetical protein